MSVAKRWLVIIGLILVVVVVAEAMLAQIVSRAVEQGMNGLAPSDKVAASVSKRPAIAMLGGSFDRVAIDTVNTRIDKITFNEMHTVLTNVQLDRERLFFNRVVAVQEVQDITLEAVLTQDELARYINQNVKGVKNAQVAITPGKVQASSQLALGRIASLAVTLDGKVVSDGQRIKFVTDRFLINNSSVGNIGGAVLTEIPLVELKSLPFGVAVKDIVMENGRVIIFADNKR
ncbi:MAG: DUF2993 domain-containing protein [Negativicutes bacterium]|nr:DUF2993 domain-containing protein [Negativicutes bacterium]